MMRQWPAIWLVLVVILLPACLPQPTPASTTSAQVSTPSLSTAASPETAGSLGEITGTIEQASNRWPDTPVYVFAASFEGDNLDQGYYYLDSSTSPSGEVGAQGHFDIANLPAGHYVLVVGPSAEEALRLVTLDQEYFLVEVTAGEKTDLGKLLISN